MIWRACLLVLLLPGAAAAHGNLPGGGGFASGFAHPFVAVEHLLLLLALGGLAARQMSRRPLLALFVGVLAGFGLAILQLPLPFVTFAILIMALVMGGLLAANRPLHGQALLAFAALAGLAVGSDTEAPAATALAARAGTLVAVFAIVLNSMAAAQFGAARLGGVPLRVAGSWIVASALLILAFLWRSAGQGG